MEKVWKYPWPPGGRVKFPQYLSPYDPTNLIEKLNSLYPFGRSDSIRFLVRVEKNIRQDAEKNPGCYLINTQLVDFKKN
ncbi:MAG: hypothetical protein QXQ29_00985 [Candidatus Bathyarchaeia archaeon]